MGGKKKNLIPVLLCSAIFIIALSVTEPGHPYDPETTDPTTFIDSWSEDGFDVGGCACHGSSTSAVESGGSISVRTNDPLVDNSTPNNWNVNNSITFSLQANITGFTSSSDEYGVVGLAETADSWANDNTEWTTNGGSLDAVSLTLTAGSGTVTLDLTAPTSEAFDGVYTLHFDAVVSSDMNTFHYASVDQNITVTVVTVDTQGPSLQVLAPENNTEVSGTITLKVNASDNIGINTVSYFIDGANETSIPGNETTGIYETTVDTLTLENGIHYYTFRVSDTSGNTSTSFVVVYVNNVGLPEADVYLYKVSTGPVVDGVLEDLWKDVQGLAIPEFGSSGYIKFVHDSEYLYGVLAYRSTYTWISIQWDSTGAGTCMNPGDDTWWFRSTSSSADYSSISATQTLDEDSSQDIEFQFGEISADYKFVEIKRKLSPTDSDDVSLALGQKTYFLAASNDPAKHKGTHTVLSIAMTDQGPSGETTIPNGGTDEDPAELTDIVIVISLVLTVTTIFIHAGLRVISRPIKHEQRIVFADEIERIPIKDRLKEFIPGFLKSNGDKPKSDNGGKSNGDKPKSDTGGKE